MANICRSNIENFVGVRVFEEIKNIGNKMGEQRRKGGWKKEERDEKVERKGKEK